MTVSMNSSLSAILSSYGHNAAAGTGQSEASAVVNTALQKLAAQSAQKTDTTTTSGTQVSISAAALAAATAQADNAKDPAALSTETRAALDTQYAAGTAKGAADLSGLSGRALAIIALDKEGRFSPAESRAARQALREDTQASFTEAMGGGGLNSMVSFSKQIAAQYDAMSPEEREARGWTEQLRNTSANFASTVSIPSMFDQM